MNKVEQTYTDSEAEMLALVWATKYLGAVCIADDSLLKGITLL